MVPLGLEDRVTIRNPPLTISDMRLVTVDTEGRPIEFHAVPPQLDATAPSAPARANWTALFSLAGLNQTDFQPVPPQWTPRSYSDERGPGRVRSRDGLSSVFASRRRHTEDGRSFSSWSTRGPSPPGCSRPRRHAPRNRRKPPSRSSIVAVLAGAALVARHNLRKRRGDRRGALRISIVVLAGSLLSWTTGSAHFASATDEMNRFFTAVGTALFAAGMLWLLYLALEPYVRKFWPATLVSWSRLLAGNYRDPQVWRDVLIGTLFGITIVLSGRLELQLRPLLGFPALPLQVPGVALEGTRQMVAPGGRHLQRAFNSLWIIFALVAINLVVRRLWITAAVMVAFLMMTAAGGIDGAPPMWLRSDAVRPARSRWCSSCSGSACSRRS